MSDALPELSKYEMLERLASGGMGEVFVARRKGAHELCVIKLMHPHLGAEPAARGRFLREAQVSALLAHPRIAKLTDAGYEDGRMYLAMELVAGQTLTAILDALLARSRLLPRALAVHIVLEVLEALEYAHSLRSPDGSFAGVVHRDLSTRNVMVSYAGDVMVIDFGLVRSEVGEYRTRPGAIMGTPQYMSPEQATGDEVDARSDLYSISVVLFELLTGKRVVGSGELIVILKSIVNTPAPRVSTLVPDVPPALEAAIAKGLEKERDARFRTARELKDALFEATRSIAAGAGDPRAELAALLGELFPDDRAKMLGAIEALRRDEPAVQPTRAVPVQSIRSTAPLPPPPKRTPWMPIALVGIAIAAVAAVAILASPQDPPTVVVASEPQPATPAPKITARERPREEREPKPQPKPLAPAPPPVHVEQPERPEPAPAPKPDPAREELRAIRTLIAREDTPSLIAAADRIRALAKKHDAPAAIACLDDSATLTAPSASALQQALNRCYEVLAARVANLR